MTLTQADLPDVRGKLSFEAPLAPYTWFRVGGPADALFLPADEDDLASFLSQLDPSIPVTVLGIGSNVIVRDGGIEGVVIRLAGRGFGGVEVNGTQITAGAAVPDAMVARKAAEAGIAGLEFFSGVPGAIGGALRMNAGCYGSETKDVVTEIRAVTRAGEHVTLTNAQMGYSYRHSEAPTDMIFTSAVFEGE
ncbi:MAG: FAD-binding protein, partial [Pseudomonadota bacterium]